jgi:hypothetical protein
VLYEILTISELDKKMRMITKNKCNRLLAHMFTLKYVKHAAEPVDEVAQRK